MTKSPVIALRFRVPDSAVSFTQDQNPQERKDGYIMANGSLSITYDRSSTTVHISPRPLAHQCLFICVIIVSGQMTPDLPGKREADSAVFRQLEAVSLAEGVVAALKDAFFSGALKPGAVIVERQIAKQMNVGTPVVREALISLKHEGFVRRVKNKGTFITAFDADEVRQLYTLRVELETLALQWARPLVTKTDLDRLKTLVDRLVEAGQRENRREFLECDIEFHRYCWKLSGNPFLAETLERLMAPLFAFVVLASGHPMTAAMGREHYALVEALRSMEEPEFSALVRKTFTGFAFRWISSAAPRTAGAFPSEPAST